MTGGVSKMDNDLAAPRPARRVAGIGLAFLRLGMISFGGPPAHIAFFRDEFVVRRGWLSEQAFAELVALCSSLPGATSSQVCLAIATLRGGWIAGLVGFVAFAAPAVVLMIAVAFGAVTLGDRLDQSVLNGLKIAALVIVARAVFGMAATHSQGAVCGGLSAAGAIAVLAWPGPWTAIIAIFGGAAFGLALLRQGPVARHDELPASVGHRFANLNLLVLIGLLVGLPLVAAWLDAPVWRLIDGFYRAGAMVFGGGHVVLPMLQAEVVPPGWIDSETFLAGYGAVQAVPGPIFSFAAYLGVAFGLDDNAGAMTSIGLGLLAVGALYLASVLSVWGTLPYWQALAGSKLARGALRGINAVVVGLLFAAAYDPLWVTTIHGVRDVVVMVLAFAALTFWRLPAWAVVPLAALAVWLLPAF